MLTGFIRENTTVTTEVEADALDEIRDALDVARPAGFELTSTSVSMPKASGMIRSVATFTSRGEIRQVEGADLAAVRTLVPAGWQLLYVTTS